MELKEIVTERPVVTGPSVTLEHNRINGQSFEARGESSGTV